MHTRIQPTAGRHTYGSLASRGTLPASQKGTLHKTTQAIIEMMHGEAEAITRVAIEKAKGGDMTALKLVLDRIAPPVKGRTIKMGLPPIDTIEDF